jgi:hypothetical protein
MASTVVSRWTAKLQIRRGLLARARARLAYWKVRHRQSVLWKLSRDERARRWDKVQEAERDVRKRKEQVAEAQRVINRHRNTDHLWGGSRAVTNEVIRIVDGRVGISSRKRDETYGNPDSDHHVSQKSADAVDFLTGENYALAREIAQRLGGSWSGDYDSFIIQRNGKLYRVQIIAGTHGTGPHLHVGVRRV